MPPHFRRSVCRLVGRPVCYNCLKGRKVTQVSDGSSVIYYLSSQPNFFLAPHLLSLAPQSTREMCTNTPLHSLHGQHETKGRRQKSVSFGWYTPPKPQTIQHPFVQKVSLTAYL